jgi:hypothetical protein
MVHFTMVRPTSGEKVGPGPLVVSGIVPWIGGPGVPVTIQLDHETPVTTFAAGCSYVQHVGGMCFWAATVDVPAVSGSHVITATTNGQTARVTIEVVEDLANTLLTGTCFAKAALSFSSPLSSSDPVALQFLESPSGWSVKITNFPVIAFPTITLGSTTVSILWITHTVTVTLDVIMQLDPSSPVTGTFDSATGVISIPDVLLDVSATNTIANIPFIGSNSTTQSGQLAVTLTTATTSSPETPPVFTDTGGNLQSSGQVLLVGDGMYSTPIFGMTDGGIALAGVIAPPPATTSPSS